MRNESYHRIFQNLIGLGAFLSLMLAPPAPPSFANPQTDVEAKVQEAVSFIRNREIQRGMAQLKELGSPSVPYVLDYVSREAYRYPLIKTLLLEHFVSLTRGDEADSALIKLLSDKQPELRGYAASELGKRKVKSAIPGLVSLLNDKADTRIIVHLNDSSPDVLVRDSVIGALESITGIKLVKGKSKEKQAKAWLGWWRKQQRKMSGGIKNAS